MPTLLTRMAARKPIKVDSPTRASTVNWRFDRQTFAADQSAGTDDVAAELKRLQRVPNGSEEANLNLRPDALTSGSKLLDTMTSVAPPTNGVDMSGWATRGRVIGTGHLSHRTGVREGASEAYLLTAHADDGGIGVRVC